MSGNSAHSAQAMGATRAKAAERMTGASCAKGAPARPTCQAFCGNEAAHRA